MKKPIIVILLITFVAICSFGVFAETMFYPHRPDRPVRHDWPDLDRDARYIIHRT